MYTYETVSEKALAVIGQWVEAIADDTERIKTLRGNELKILFDLAKAKKEQIDSPELSDQSAGEIKVFED